MFWAHANELHQKVLQGVFEECFGIWWKLFIIQNVEEIENLVMNHERCSLHGLWMWRRITYILAFSMKFLWMCPWNQKIGVETWMCTIRNQVHGILWTWSIWAWTESTDISCAKCEGLQIPDRLAAITGWKSLAHSRLDIIPCSRKISGQSPINVILLYVHSVQDTNLCIYCGAQ